RRTRRAVSGALATVTVLALIWPASIVAGSTSSAAPSRTAGSAAAKQTDRQPSVHGLGVQPFEANRDAKRTKPLKHLAGPQTNRGTTTTSRGPRAATAVPPV